MTRQRALRLAGVALSTLALVASGLGGLRYPLRERRPQPG